MCRPSNLLELSQSLDRPANPLLNLVARVTNSVLLHIIEIQRVELEMYKVRDPRIRLTKAERRQLVKLAKPLGTKIREVLFVCAYGTLLRWKRGGEQPTRKDSLGRTPLPQDLRQLVVKLAEEIPPRSASRHGSARMPVLATAPTMTSASIAVVTPIYAFKISNVRFSSPPTSGPTSRLRMATSLRNPYLEF